jgi:methyl-accepting chemotaxis protein
MCCGPSAKSWCAASASATSWSKWTMRAASRSWREKRTSYILVLAAQALISLLLIVLFLNSRLIKPLRKLMRFSDRLSHGDFETRLDLTGSDELGRWRSSWSRCGWRSSACSRTSASARNVSAPS